MNTTTGNPTALSSHERHAEEARRVIINILHIIVLVLSLFLVISISIDTFKNIAFYKQPEFLKTQFWICIAFLGDFILEFIFSKRKWKFLTTHFLFLLVSIPYLNIIQYFGWQFPEKINYLLRFIPLVRGGYALAIVVGWFSYNKAVNLFLTYVVTLLATIYFGSLVFFVFERSINPLVESYDDALWWAFMDATTVGSNITAVTPVGRILSVLLAALGMMMFPIFTVYVTALIKKKNEQSPFQTINVENSSSTAEGNGSESTPSSEG